MNIGKILEAKLVELLNEYHRTGNTEKGFEILEKMCRIDIILTKLLDRQFKKNGYNYRWK